MNTVGYYSWDENKQVYTAPWEKCFRSGGASSCVGPHEEIAYMGQLYAMDSAEFRKKFGEDLYNFYYHFFDENTYYHYDS